MTQHTVVVDGTTFAYLEDGPADADLVLLVHGFPDSPRSWSTVIERLSAAGHRVVAPFQRGYAPTQVPTDGRYQPGRLALDVAGLVEALSNGRPVTLVGHDWGALAVYGAANLVPDRVRAVVGMSIPPGLSPTDPEAWLRCCVGAHQLSFPKLLERFRTLIRRSLLVPPGQLLVLTSQCFESQDVKRIIVY